jgi:repressor LexA
MMIAVMTMNEIAQRLSDSIAASKLSYGELSKRTRIPKSAIQRYATGATEKIPLERLRALASALGVSLSALAPWEDASAAPRDELPEITMIARAGQKMSPERRQDMLRLLQIAFPEEFRDDDGT